MCYIMTLRNSLCDGKRRRGAVASIIAAAAAAVALEL